MPKRPRNKALDYLAYLGLRLFESIVQMFDVSTNYRTARLLGDLWYRFDKRHRRIAMGHLRLSFPDWSEEQYEQVARESFRWLFYFALEVLFSTRLITPTRWRRHIRLGANAPEALRLLVEGDGPMLMVTGHFGNWEVLGYTLATLGFPMVAVARPLDNPYINDYILGVRERTGLTILDKKGAMHSMNDILSAGGSVGFIADQDAGRRGMFVDFFGRPASTYKSVGLLAMHFEAPVLVGYTRRLDDHFTFEFSVERIIRPDEWADKDDPLRWITQAYTHAIERVVRKAPGQYLWVHRRWKHRPGGEKAGKDGVA